MKLLERCIELDPAREYYRERLGRRTIEVWR